MFLHNEFMELAILYKITMIESFGEDKILQAIVIDMWMKFMEKVAIKLNKALMANLSRAQL